MVALEEIVTRSRLRSILTSRVTAECCRVATDSVPVKEGLRVGHDEHRHTPADVVE